jgi:hypothetical protein
MAGRFDVRPFVVSTTSAIPERLAHFSAECTRADDDVLGRARVLPHDLAPAIIRFANVNLEVDRWVGRVATAFFVADGRPGFIGPVAPHVVTMDDAVVGYDPFASLRAGAGTEWADAVWGGRGGDPSCGAWGFYTGGGFLTGPDGREYPLVIPSVRTTDGVYNANRWSVGAESRNASTLGGSDTGWTGLYVTSGTHAFGEPASGLEKFFVFFGGTTGFQHPGGRPVGADVYRSMAISPLGVPSLGLTPSTAGEGPPLTDAEPWEEYRPVLRDGRIVNDPQYNPSLHRLQAAAGAVDLAISVLQGVDTVVHYDDNRLARYQVVFEVNDDGRRRATLRAFTATTMPDGHVRIYPNYLSLDGDGELVATPMTFVPETVITSTPPDDALVVELFQPRPDDD